jgi:hypothetical protein
LVDLNDEFLVQDTRATRTGLTLANSAPAPAIMDKDKKVTANLMLPGRDGIWSSLCYVS